MTTSRQGFILAYNPNSKSSHQLVYRSPESVSTESNSNSGINFSLGCIHISRGGQAVCTLTTEIKFVDDKQRDAFETALRNNDAKTALEINESISPTPKDHFDDSLFNPVSYFLRGYIKHQDKLEKQKASVLSKIGLYGNKDDTIRNAVIEAGDPRLTPPAKFTF